MIKKLKRREFVEYCILIVLLNVLIAKLSEVFATDAFSHFVLWFIFLVIGISLVRMIFDTYISRYAITCVHNAQGIGTPMYLLPDGSTCAYIQDGIVLLHKRAALQYTHELQQAYRDKYFSIKKLT